MTTPGDKADQAQVRTATIVIVGAVVIWFAGSAVGGALGLPVRMAFLLDLACMAALFWALVVLIRVWYRRQTEHK